MTDPKLEPASLPSDPVGDVIFVHGLGGDANRTWTRKGCLTTASGEKQSYKSFFPSLLADDFPTIGIWSLDYHAAATNWGPGPLPTELFRACAAISEVVLSEGICTRPTVFVCHSLGGLVVKQLLITSMASKVARKRRLFESTRAVSFLATPHKGSNWASILRSVDGVLPFLRASPNVEALGFDNAYLEQLSAQYRSLARPDVMETQAFYERRRTRGAMIVEHVSANPDIEDCTPIPVNANHLGICKPSGKGSIVYTAVKSLVQEHLLLDVVGNGIDTTADIPPQTVAIGVVVRGKEVLMVRRSHTVSNLTWQFVGGRVRIGEESIHEAVVREVFEETNVSVRADAILAEAEDDQSPFRRVYLRCSYLFGEPSNTDERENSDVRWVPIVEVAKFVTTPLHPAVVKFLASDPGD